MAGKVSHRISLKQGNRTVVYDYKLDQYWYWDAQADPEWRPVRIPFWVWIASPIVLLLVSLSDSVLNSYFGSDVNRPFILAITSILGFACGEFFNRVVQIRMSRIDQFVQNVSNEDVETLPLLEDAAGKFALFAFAVFALLAITVSLALTFLLSDVGLVQLFFVFFFASALVFLQRLSHPQQYLAYIYKRSMLADTATTNSILVRACCRIRKWQLKRSG
jgi:hypothetical protein